jgi:hypothetical protein
MYKAEYEFFENLFTDKTLKKLQDNEKVET